MLNLLNLVCNFLFSYLLLLLFTIFNNSGRPRQSQPAEIEDEIDVDFMRAVQLSLLQHSTPANQRSRQSSSSSSLSSGNRDQAHGVQAPQDMSYLSVVDGASLQKAIELSLQDSAVGGSC